MKVVSNALRVCLFAMLALAVTASIAHLSPMPIAIEAASVEVGYSGDRLGEDTTDMSEARGAWTCPCPADGGNPDCHKGPCSVGHIASHADLYPPLARAARASPAIDRLGIAQEPALEPPRLIV